MKIGECGVEVSDIHCSQGKAAKAVGSVFSSDTFYDDADSLRDWQKIGVLAVEMECAALYLNAARLGKKALAICTISDCPFTGESSSSAERQTSFRRMMEIGLQTAVTAQK